MIDKCVGLHLKAAGRAMARHKEEKIFREFTRHGHTVFDNSITTDTHPHLTENELKEAKTTGRGENGTLNDTLSVDDILDLIIAVMANGYTPTDVLMHPLVWTIFAKNALLGSMGRPPESPDGSFKLGPESIQGRIPFGVTIWLSPFVPFNREDRCYDIFVVDRNEVGILLIKDEMSTEQFDNPLRDIHTLKVLTQFTKAA